MERGGGGGRTKEEEDMGGRWRTSGCAKKHSSESSGCAKKHSSESSGEHQEQWRGGCSG